jgi:hypothetical protein
VLSEGLAVRIVSGFWEFLLMDGRVRRWKAFCGLLFPSRDIFRSVYRLRAPLGHLMLLPFHVPLTLCGVLSFVFLLFAERRGKME